MISLPASGLTKMIETPNSEGEVVPQPVMANEPMIDTLELVAVKRLRKKVAVLEIGGLIRTRPDMQSTLQ